MVPSQLHGLQLREHGLAHIIADGQPDSKPDCQPYQGADCEPYQEPHQAAEPGANFVSNDKRTDRKPH